MTTNCASGWRDKKITRTPSVSGTNTYWTLEQLFSTCYFPHLSGTHYWITALYVKYNRRHYYSFSSPWSYLCSPVISQRTTKTQSVQDYRRIFHSNIGHDSQRSLGELYNLLLGGLNHSVTIYYSSLSVCMKGIYAYKYMYYFRMYLWFALPH